MRRLQATGTETLFLYKLNQFVLFSITPGQFPVSCIQSDYALTWQDTLFDLITNEIYKSLWEWHACSVKQY